MIITIDGPTASGKSTVARLLAEELGYLYINSGLLYRGLAYILMHKALPAKCITIEKIPLFEKALLDRPELLHVQFIESIVAQEAFHYHFARERGPTIFIHREDITPLLKSPEIDAASSIIAVHASVRQVLLDYQRKIASNHDVIADGRDCGTVVFPHADYKFFLTASLEVRTHRQSLILDPRYSHYTFNDWKKFVEERDERDSTRTLAPLKPAPDGYLIDSSDMTVQEVLTEITDMVSKYESIV